MREGSNNIIVAPVRNLDVGDLVTFEFLGGAISGRISGIAHLVNDLTPEQRAYMETNNLIIPEGRWDSIGGATQCVIFGRFVGYHDDAEIDRVLRTSGHFFRQYDDLVVVFQKD